MRVGEWLLGLGHWVESEGPMRDGDDCAGRIDGLDETAGRIPETGGFAPHIIGVSIGCVSVRPHHWFPRMVLERGSFEIHKGGQVRLGSGRDGKGHDVRSARRMERSARLVMVLL